MKTTSSCQYSQLCHCGLDPQSPELSLCHCGLAIIAIRLSIAKPHFHLILFNKTTSVAPDNYIPQPNLITLLPHYYHKMNNEVNEVGEYLLQHLLLRLFCWNKLGENEVFTALNLTVMGRARHDKTNKRIK
jgi:hypothetical protein